MRLDIFEKLVEINNQIVMYEKYLEYAFEPDVIVSLYDDILKLKAEKNVLLGLL